ncbi:MAG TPA: hydrogenase nickel incorporation protein HypB [Anaerolineae bacterium]|nr:hydrogenase nickel incorporation protein HypB [Anaerolineae bacterium]HQK13399.1 hydrogenase nickel incorporation protein HypB [Anaerolineae bacterium]
MSGQVTPTRVPVVQKLLTANEQVAADNREYFAARHVTVINIMAAPGAGKTTLLMATITALPELRIGVVEGDVASQVDADKIATTGVPVVQINTGGACHLDAPMLRRAMPELPLDDLDVLFIENVGNLICPVSFDLGQSYNVGLISLPEGDDKPYKYPAIFEAVDLVIVTKLDLRPYLDFDLDRFTGLVHGLNPDVPVLYLSAKTGEGMGDWLHWVKTHLHTLEMPPVS